ncbi:MAG TPA: TIGR03560 family F420-dependent LLM class oxidoreductase [Candidatus Binatia bacterium]|jgi:F420-dependent oxidoreductase-like protein|nr:TIGR03560 family F420-dependent LLM class oxidoreductase [Candidatus Binatia bacterium]
MRVHFGIQTPQEGATFDALAAHWREADQLGFDSVWLDDHFYSVVRPRSEPQMEAWTLLAALARETRRIRLGILVTCNAYRNPALLAKMVATVDVLSDGRLIHGIGAGWFADEYEGYGYEFPNTPTRLAQLEESLQLQELLWTAERPTFDGRFYRLRDAWCEPRPVQRPYPPILIGGSGEKVLLRIVARHASMWNCPGEPAELGRKIAILREHCAVENRRFDDIARTWFGQVIVDLEPARVRARLERVAAAWGMSPEAFAKRSLVGTPTEIIDQIHAYQAVGVTGFIGMYGRVDDLRGTRLIAERVLPAFR